MKKDLVIAFLFSLLTTCSFAQKAASTDWFNLDPKKDKIPGVSTERSYTELLKDKKPGSVIVAVIDGGTDTEHPDLKNVLWTNEKEIAGNGLDDDHNGYIDDIHGWNFIGGKDGKDVNADNLELTRVYKTLHTKYVQAGAFDKNTDEYAYYQKIKMDYTSKLERAKTISTHLKSLISGINNIQKETGKENPSTAELKSYKPSDLGDMFAAKVMLDVSKKRIPAKELKEQISAELDYYQKQIDIGLNQDLDERKIVGDDYSNPDEKIYGNNHYAGPSAHHGTHVAGIIGAQRNNNTGMNGVADHVRIMVVRVVPDGDERDKDVANGIRYAVDNGARVINMSFGKTYSPDKSTVDEAVKYAVSKGVLIVHAAGNDAKNTDTTNNFPKDVYLNSDITAASWIEVGASSWKKGKYVAADFSNYGKKNVDVFSPGVDIYSTLPGSTYGTYDGTSMAAPVTAGVAALIMSYYPSLTAIQVKEIILQSVIKVKGKVLLPGNPKKKVKMTDLCLTGGIVNAYEALKLAEKTVTR